ncbi:HpcH/HpaI aldolase family protein [Sphingobium algorifonticola]|uniref:Aldolase n=1 Tax=Sphingobium algorifonticola TaxID=2008318 RepID=A0A437J914_9SPHN|nr:aldolase/citrate lyase family protein [Sphingobium algorifonticola]RVT41996.1 aldolase [Sphingobium algorifonticola]
MTLKQRIAAGEALFGTFLKTPAPMLVEVLATAGIDLLCLDAEHAPFDRAAIDACIHAARAAHLPVIVRTQTAAHEHILNALDCGADGVLLPHIRSAAEAQAAARAAHYGPGGRGYAGSSRAAGYGLSGMADHRTASAARTVVIAQIEDIEALADIDAIAAVDGIDALFVGRIDLTVALEANSPDDPAVLAAVDRILAAGTATGRPVGMFVPRNADVAQWREKGATLFLQGSDHGFLRAGAAAARIACGM